MRREVFSLRRHREAVRPWRSRGDCGRVGMLDCRVADAPRNDGEIFSYIVMPGLDPGICLGLAQDGRVKPGHDGEGGNGVLKAGRHAA